MSDGELQRTFLGVPVILLALVLILVIAAVVWALSRARHKGVGGRETTQAAAAAQHYAKRCPTCQAIYADETLAFCLSDGSTLERVPAPARQRDPDATLVYADAPRSELAPTVQSNPEEPPGL